MSGGVARTSLHPCAFQRDGEQDLATNAVEDPVCDTVDDEGVHPVDRAKHEAKDARRQVRDSEIRDHVNQGVQEAAEARGGDVPVETARHQRPAEIVVVVQLVEVDVLRRQERTDPAGQEREREQDAVDDSRAQDGQSEHWRLPVGAHASTPCRLPLYSGSVVSLRRC